MLFKFNYDSIYNLLSKQWHILKYKNNCKWSSHRGSAEINLTRNHELVGSIPGLAQWVKDLALPWAVV